MNKRNNFCWYLTKKYLCFDKAQPSIALSAILAFLSVSVGLMVLMISMSIMNGFMKEFEEKLFTMNYPITVFPIGHTKVKQQDVDNLAEKFPNLKLSPYLESQVVIKRGQKFEAAKLFGVNLQSEGEINSVINNALINVSPLNEFDILVGSKIQEKLLLDTGDKMTVVFIKLDAGGFTLIPKMKRFTYQASFTSELIAYDDLFMFTPISGLAKVLGYENGIYDGIHIYSNNPTKDIELLKKSLPSNLISIGWWEQNGGFFSAFELEKKALFIVLMLIVLVAALNITSSLLMTVMSRRQEIALLLSLGAKPSEIKKSFFGLGMIIGFGGIVVGILLGFLGLFLLDRFDIVTLDSTVYGFSKLPLDLAVLDFSFIVLGAILIIAISSYYPAKKATEVDILKTLRNE